MNLELDDEDLIVSGAIKNEGSTKPFRLQALFDLITSKTTIKSEDGCMGERFLVINRKSIEVWRYSKWRILTNNRFYFLIFSDLSSEWRKQCIERHQKNVNAELTSRIDADQDETVLVHVYKETKEKAIKEDDESLENYIKIYKESDSLDVKKVWLKKFKENLPIRDEKPMQKWVFWPIAE